MTEERKQLGGRITDEFDVTSSGSSLDAGLEDELSPKRADKCDVSLCSLAAIMVLGFLLVAIFLIWLAIPVLGHATWHLYRKAVKQNPNPHPDYQPREKSQRSATDFPAVLFATRW
jgi:hypothetical protein